MAARRHVHEVDRIVLHTRHFILTSVDTLEGGPASFTAMVRISSTLGGKDDVAESRVAYVLVAQHTEIPCD